MMFSVATNFDPAPVDALRECPVVEWFSKSPEDAVGGGRAASGVRRCPGIHACSGRSGWFRMT